MFIGIDIGSTVVKALLVSPGGELGMASRRLRASNPRPGWLECEAGSIWGAVFECLGELHSKFGYQFESVQGIGLCGYGNGAILLDESGEPLRPFILSGDRRATGVLREFEESVDADWLHGKIRQKLYPGQLALLLRWVKENEPEVFCRVHRAMLVKDYVRWRLTGAWETDFSDAGATGLVDIEAGAYDEALLSALGVGGLRSALPPMRPSASCEAHVRAEVAERTGLRSGIPVAVGCIDCEAGSIGSGVSDTNTLSIVAGTWSINQRLSESLPADPDIFLSSLSARENLYWILEGSATSASNFDWFVQTWGDREWAEAEDLGMNPFAHCCQLAESAPLREDGIIFLPYLFGSPSSSEARACFWGMRSDHGRDEMIRAVLEGIAFGHRFHVERLLRIGPHLDRAALSGGLSRSPFVAQLFADVLDMRVDIPSTEETGALGAALLAGVGTGCWACLEEAQAALCAARKSYHPTASRVEIYNEKYRKYSDISQRLASMEVASQLNPEAIS